MTPQLLREQTPKARKPHRCKCCYATVQTEEIYQRQTYVHDGRLFDWVTCNGCAAITNWVWAWAPEMDREEFGIGADDYTLWAEETAGPRFPVPGEPPWTRSYASEAEIDGAVAYLARRWPNG